MTVSKARLAALYDIEALAENENLLIMHSYITEQERIGDNWL